MANFAIIFLSINFINLKGWKYVKNSKWFHSYQHVKGWQFLTKGLFFIWKSKKNKKKWKEYQLAYGCNKVFHLAKAHHCNVDYGIDPNIHSKVLIALSRPLGFSHMLPRRVALNFGNQDSRFSSMYFGALGECDIFLYLNI